VKAGRDEVDSEVAGVEESLEVEEEASTEGVREELTEVNTEVELVMVLPEAHQTSQLPLQPLHLKLE